MGATLFPQLLEKHRGHGPLLRIGASGRQERTQSWRATTTSAGRNRRSFST